VHGVGDALTLRSVAGECVEAPGWSRLSNTKGSSRAWHALRAPPNTGVGQVKRYMYDGTPRAAWASASQMAGRRKTRSVAMAVYTSRGVAPGRLRVYTATDSSARVPNVDSTSFATPAASSRRCAGRAPGRGSSRRGWCRRGSARCPSGRCGRPGAGLGQDHAVDDGLEGQADLAIGRPGPSPARRGRRRWWQPRQLTRGRHPAKSRRSAEVSLAASDDRRSRRRRSGGSPRGRGRRRPVVPSSVPTLIAPADSPKTVTGPDRRRRPRCLSRTHSSARTWSRIPRFPEARPVVAPVSEVEEAERA